MKRIQLPRRKEIRTKSKTILLILALTAASFTAGVFANQVIVNNIQALAGNHSLVPAPELVINSTSWNINLNSSTVIGVTLNVLTISKVPTTVTKLYQIFIQVSCLDASGREFTCATGSTTVTLPSNGGSATLFVPISPQIDPELIEIHDLSFIVTGTPTTTGGCTPDFTISANPANLTLSSNGTSAPTIGFVNKTITSLCKFSGNVTLSVSTNGGFSISLSSITVFLPAGGTVSILETINAKGVAPGNYLVKNTATSGSLSHSVIINVSVIP